MRDSYLVTVFWPAIRVLHKMRKLPGVEFGEFRVSSSDSVELLCRRLGSNPSAAVIVAHPAIGGSTLGQVVDLAEELSRSFSVITLDFRGHDESTGRCPVGFSKVSKDLEAVVDAVKEMGFDRLGFAGFSLGAAAGFVLEGRRRCFDSFVSIGCPPALPDVGPWKTHPLMSRACSRIMGMRFDPTIDAGPAPIDVAADITGIPKLIVFGEYEVSPPEQIADFSARISEPKELITIPGVWHADLGGREAMVREWFERTLA